MLGISYTGYSLFLFQGLGFLLLRKLSSLSLRNISFPLIWFSINHFYASPGNNLRGVFILFNPWGRATQHILIYFFQVIICQLVNSAVPSEWVAVWGFPQSFVRERKDHSFLWTPSYRVLSASLPLPFGLSNFLLSLHITHRPQSHEMPWWTVWPTIWVYFKKNYQWGEIFRENTVIL